MLLTELDMEELPAMSSQDFKRDLARGDGELELCPSHTTPRKSKNAWMPNNFDASSTDEYPLRFGIGSLLENVAMLQMGNFQVTSVADT